MVLVPHGWRCASAATPAPRPASGSPPRVRCAPPVAGRGRGGWRGGPLQDSEGVRKVGGLLSGRPLFPAGVVVGGPHCCVAVGAVIPCAHRGGAMRTGRVGLVHPAGLEPACPWATPFEGVVYPGSTTDACSPCLLVKGADCAGDVLPVWGVVICRSCVPVLGTSPLDGQSPHRAMFAYPCSGKTTLGRLVGCM